MLLPIDVIALAVALGAIVGAPPVSRALAAVLVVAAMVGFTPSLGRLDLPWWLAPAAALFLGILVYAGVTMSAAIRYAIAAVGGVVAGTALRPALAASGRPEALLSGVALLLGVTLLLGAAMLLSWWTARRGGAWACQTARLIGGLCAFAGAVLLIRGGGE